MNRMIQTKRYYFTVEGETEQWYFKWLQECINKNPQAKQKVSFDCQIQKNPLKRAKSLVITGKTTVWHISDYESNDPVHTEQFRETMDKLKEAERLGKQISYKLGYSNFTFDLWIILHKSDLKGSVIHRNRYITPINRAYNEHFENMEEYKREANFKRCLGKLSIQDVIDAVNRAKDIMRRNNENGLVQHEYKGYRYYTENPSLEIWQAIESILKDCGLKL